MSEDLKKELQDLKNEVALLRTTMIGLNKQFEEAKEAYRVSLVRIESKDHDWNDVWSFKRQLTEMFKTIEDKVKWRDTVDEKVDEIRRLFQKIDKISEIVKDISSGY